MSSTRWRGLRPVNALLVSLLVSAGTVLGQPPIVDSPPSLAWAAGRVENVDRRPFAETLMRAGLDLPSNIRVTLIPNADPRAMDTPPWIIGLALEPRDIVLFPERTPTYPYASLESVIRHEMAHLALTARAGGRPLPRWFHEGVAVSVEAGWGITDQLRLLGAIAAAPTIGEVNRLFQSGARPDSARAYLLAAALVDDIRRRHGADIPGALAGRVAEGIPFERAFVLETGETVEGATARAWRGYVRWARWALVVLSPSGVWAAILALAGLAFVVQRRRRARRRREWDDEDASVAEPSNSA